VAVGYEFFEATRAALIAGTLTMVISHPMTAFANEVVASMVKAKKAGPGAGAQNITLGFEIYTSENV
jgi:LacI family transcriptional regulator